jgi:hypothetical protein
MMVRPSPEEIATLPELATLAILDAALDTTEDMFRAIFPDDENWTAVQEAAENIIDLATGLRDAITDYTAALNCTRSLPLVMDPDCPF